MLSLLLVFSVVPAPMAQLLNLNVGPLYHPLSLTLSLTFFVYLCTEPPAAGPSQPASTSAPKNPNFHFGGDAEDEPEDAPAENEEGEQQQMEGQAGAEEEKEDDLENAFQMLDMARAILSKVDSSEAKLKLAGVHNALGEIATESGQLYPIRLAS